MQAIAQICDISVLSSATEPAQVLNTNMMHIDTMSEAHKQLRV